MNQTVPPTRRIRPSRVRNIDTARLISRHTYLIDNRGAIARAADGRKRLREYARELHTVAGELARRQGG